MSIDLSGLDAHAERLKDVSLKQLIGDDLARAEDFALRVGPLYASFARQSYDRLARDALLSLARDADLSGAMQRLVDGLPVNITEGRAALHTALRGDLPRAVIAQMTAQCGGDATGNAACTRLQAGLSETGVARDASAHAAQARQRMAALIDELAKTDVTDIVSVGIGGSDLGPRMVVDALVQPDTPVSGQTDSSKYFRVHFVSNVDGAAMQRTLAALDPRKTAAILISKTFGTQETLLNGGIVRDWLGDSASLDGGRVYAVSANVQRAAEFGIDESRILPMWDWVGGRYSLWSAVGFPIALAIGMQRFEALLAGAALMDAHVCAAPLNQNMAVLHALTAIWNRNACGAATQAVLPYDERLKLLPNYLQQLVMESLGKRVKLDGAPVDADTVPVWWGGPGTDTQHSFFQALHQGTQVVPADFIGVIRNADPYADNHAALLANLLAQTEAFANGQASDDPHRIYPGNRPSTLLLLDALTPESLGMLIALYEHSVYLQAVLWGINAFDQFGVELGKQVAGTLLPAVRGEGEADDVVTRALLREIRTRT